MVAKDRFGGLFSVLSGRDINTLRQFEVWVQEEDLSPDTEIIFGGDVGFDLTERPGSPGTDFITTDYILSLPLEDVLAFVKGWYNELKDECNRMRMPEAQEYEIGTYGTYTKDPLHPGHFDRLTACRRWMGRLHPIVRKLERGLYKFQNEELR